MKLNNKGFAISTIMYMILIMAVILITLTLTLLSSRKLILDKAKQVSKDVIYSAYGMSYRDVLEILKEEAVNYATNKNLEKDSIKIENLNSSIEKETLDKYELSEKYLTMVSTENSYDVYLGKSSIVTTNVTIENLIDVIDYNIYGNSIQNSEPTVTSPVEIETVGDLVTDSNDSNYGKYRIPIKISGKNLFDVNKVYGGLIYTNKNYSYKPSLDGGGTLFLEVEPNTTYYYSADVSSLTTGILSINLIYNIVNPTDYIDDNVLVADKQVYYTGMARGSQKFTTDEYTKMVAISYYRYNEIPTNVQLELGDTQTEYEPCIVNISNIYVDEPLRKIGNYTDYIDFEKQKTFRNVVKADLKDLTWTTSGSSFSDSQLFLTAGASAPKHSQTLSNYFIYRSNIWSYNYIGIDGYYDGLPKVKVRAPYLTMSEFTDFINSSKVEAHLINVTEAPIEKDVELPKILTKIGYNSNISIDTKIQPSNYEFTIIQKIKQL